MRPSANVRRRFKRGALPSALMGLVTFSFTLVVFGAAVYTSTLPSLVMAGQRGVSDSLLLSVLEAVAGGDGFATDQGDAKTDAAVESEQGKGGEGAWAGDNLSAADASQHTTFSLNGLSLQGIAQNIANSGSEAEQPNDEQEPQQKPDGEGSGEAGGSNDAETGGNEGQTKPSSPDPEPDPVKEQAFYEFLVSKAQLIEGYLAEVNACVDAFNADCTTASLDVRVAHQRECESLENRLASEYLAVLNIPLSEIPENTKYRDEQGDLIAMFRCLCGYVGTIGNAWTLNVAFEDPAAHVDEFMSAIYADEQNGVNKYLAEFQQYADGFEL